MCASDDWRNLVVVAGMVFIEWAFLYFLFRKKIFLKV
jgi:hypothetical protein